MKKTLALILISSATFGQGLFVKLGLTSNTPSNNQDNNKNQSEAKIGFGGGLGYNFAISKNKKWALQPEVTFNSYKDKNSDQTLPTYKIASIQIPVLLDYTMNKTHIQLGPQIDYLLNYTILDTKFTDSFNKTGVSGVIGLSQMLTKNISLAARYRAALKGYAGNDLIPGTSLTTLKEKNIGLSLQYHF